MCPGTRVGQVWVKTGICPCMYNLCIIPSKAYSHSNRTCAYEMEYYSMTFEVLLCVVSAQHGDYKDEKAAVITPALPVYIQMNVP